MGIRNIFNRTSKRRYPTCRADKIKWDIKPVPKRIVAIGDIHGDIEALGSILYDRKLINKKGEWTGARTHLVLTGDLIGGHNTRLVIQFVMRLEDEAEKSGGDVHSLIGNHDILMLCRNQKKQEGNTLFDKFPVSGEGGHSIREAFSRNTREADWLRHRNTIIKIGRIIFTHAGLNEWVLTNSIGRVNATVRAWIRYWQGADKMPGLNTDWIVSGNKSELSLGTQSSGPIWTRSYKSKKVKKNNGGRGERIGFYKLTAILRKCKADKMVVGHTPVPENNIVMAHPYYGDMVIMIDTRISRKKQGRLSCLEIHGGKITDYYSKRNKVGEKIKILEKKKLKKN
ncbi:MAG: metallophosphoesterase [Spirochaetales bacterium]|nr:metallophosphoesterase [Spirochaetales bacterium]